MTEEISLSLDLINVKDNHNFWVSVLRPWLFVAIQLYWNFKLYCFYFFQILHLQIGGVAYLQMRLIHGHLWYTEIVSWSLAKGIHLFQKKLSSGNSDRSFQDGKESWVYNSVNGSCWVLYICISNWIAVFQYSILLRIEQI